MFSKIKEILHVIERRRIIASRTMATVTLDDVDEVARDKLGEVVMVKEPER